MAGKTRKPKTGDKRGGGRPNSGPKKQERDFSRDVKAAYIKAAEELAEEFGEPIEKAMLRLVYGDKIQDSVKASILKAYNDVLVAKESEQTVTHRDAIGPAIGLPPSKNDPAKIIPIEGGKK